MIALLFPPLSQRSLFEVCFVIFGAIIFVGLPFYKIPYYYVIHADKATGTLVVTQKRILFKNKVVEVNMEDITYLYLEGKDLYIHTYNQRNKKPSVFSLSFAILEGGVAEETQALLKSFIDA
jgi:hypothetical protein